MASIHGLEDYADFIEMGLQTTHGVRSPSSQAMRVLVRDRLQVVERQMRVLARRLDSASGGPNHWWTSEAPPPDSRFCESWSGLMYLSNTREQLLRMLRRLD